VMAMASDTSKGQTLRANGTLIDYSTDEPDLIYSSDLLLGRGAYVIESGRSLQVPQQDAAPGKNPDLERPRDKCMPIANTRWQEGLRGAEEYSERVPHINGYRQQPLLAIPTKPAQELSRVDHPASHTLRGSKCEFVMLQNL